MGDRKQARLSAVDIVWIENFTESFGKCEECWEGRLLIHACCLSVRWARSH